MKQILERSDVEKLVYSFYDKIQKDELLGPIFNPILDGRWEPHLQTMVDFWESNLLGARNFYGNPAIAHGKVDKAIDYGIVPGHFEHWVELWHETVDEHFYGAIADRAKKASLGMAQGIYGAVLAQRQIIQ